MPDSLSRYYLSEMEDYVRRIALGILYTVSPTTGAEATPASAYDTLYSQTDIDKQLNTALTLEMIRVVQLAEEAFISTVLLSVVAGQESISFPADMLTFKELSWLRPGIVNPQPYDWMPMPEIEDRQPSRFGGSAAPPWHRDGSLLVFDQPITQDNPGGIRLRYVRYVPFLVGPKDVIQSQLARPLQEVIIFDAAIALMQSKRRNVSQELLLSQKQAQETLVLAAANIHKPDATNSYSPYMVRGTFSGRRGRRSGRW